MLTFTALSLAIAVLAALTTVLFFCLRLRSRKPLRSMDARFAEVEEKVRSLKSAGKLLEAPAALEQVARDLAGEECAAKLRMFRETREKTARIKTPVSSPGEGFEGSLVIPRVFRDPDPDVGMARLFIEIGARSRGLEREMKLAGATAALAWALLAIAIALRFLGM